MPKSSLRAAKPDAAAGAPVENVLRRQPSQDRGQRRVERILDAAAEVIAEVGVDAASTNAIAARSDTSVGSVYQFFPNKEAIVHALAMRYIGMFAQFKERLFAPEVADLPLPEMIRGIVEPMANFHYEHPDYRYVYAATTVPGSVAAAAEAELCATMVANIESLIERRTPWIPPVQRHADAVEQVESEHAVRNYASELPPEDLPALLDELIRMLVAALEPFDAMRPAGASSKA
jgi:AcrR family transcriptional regulator